MSDGDEDIQFIGTIQQDIFHHLPTQRSKSFQVFLIISKVDVVNVRKIGKDAGFKENYKIIMRS